MNNKQGGGGMICLGGLWIHTSEEGEKYFSGTLSSGVKILIFKNHWREYENEPEYRIYLAAASSRRESSAPTRRPSASSESRRPAIVPRARKTRKVIGGQ